MLRATDAGSDDTDAGVECLFAEEGTVRDGRLVGTSFRMIIALPRPCLILSLLSVSPPATTMKRNNPLLSASRSPFLLEGDKVIV